MNTLMIEDISTLPLLVRSPPHVISLSPSSHNNNTTLAFCQTYRRYIVRGQAAKAKRDHEDKVRVMSRLENWATTRIQALFRGVAGRTAAEAKRVQHKGRWKEMFDEDRRANFYYNRVRGRKGGNMRGGELERSKRASSQQR